MSQEKTIEERVADLWNRVQTNEESVVDRKSILNECDELNQESTFEADYPFLFQKVRLIQHKAGKPGIPLDILAQKFEEFAKKEPSVDVWICLAETYLHLGKNDEALPPLQYAQALGENIDVLILLSICYRRIAKKDLQKSLEYAKQATKLDMKSDKAWNNLGITFLNLGGHENVIQSMKAFKCALQLSSKKNADTLVNLGAVYELLLNFKEAMNCYQEAIKITEGWKTPIESLERLKNRLKSVVERAEGINKLRTSKKTKLLQRITDDDQYLVVEAPFHIEDPSQIILCINKASEIFAFGIIKTMRAYILPEKTILKMAKPPFENLQIGDKSLKYYIIEDQSKVDILHRATPSQVAPVSITSSIA